MCRSSLRSLERGQARSGVEQVACMRSQLLESLHKVKAGDQGQGARRGNQEEKGTSRREIGREKKKKSNKLSTGQP